MIVTQEFEDSILGAQNDNYIVLSQAVDYIDVSYTLTHDGATNYTNRYASINGVVQLNIKEISRLMYSRFIDTYNYTNTVLYTENDNYHFAKLNISIQDNTIDAPIVRNVTLVNSALQKGGVLMSDFDNSPLRNVFKMPYFTGVRQSISILRNGGIERITDKTNIDFANNISEEIDECGTIIKWLNSNGGYAYWLFDDVFKDKIQVKSLGTIKDHSTIREDNTPDHHSLGYTAKKTKSLTTKVDNKYMPEVETLLTSPEVYIYLGGNSYKKVGLKTQSTTVFNSNRNTVKLNITLLLDDVVTQTLV